MTKTVAQIVKRLVTALLNDAGPMPIPSWDGSFLGTPGENASFFETLSAAQDMAGDSPHVVGQKLRARDMPTLIWTHSS